MDDFNLNWIYIGISWILLRWHDLWGSILGTEPGAASGFAWVLSIVFLVITVRAVLFPVFVKQIKSQRAMQTLQPQMKELREKHKHDQQALQREMMELYRREKANPLMGCLPIFLQIPVFIGLFHVLRLINPENASYRKAMITEYHWTAEQFDSASSARLFGAPLAAMFRSTPAQLDDLSASGVTVKLVAGVLIAIMVATTYITQRQMIARNGASADPTQALVQKFMLYGIPASLLVSGAIFPIGVVIYWVTTNLFSMGQQFWVLRKMPPPGAAQKSVTDPTVAKALAPKPGVKPVNPKKGGRPTAGVTAATPGASSETADGTATTRSTTARRKVSGQAQGSGTTAAGARPVAKGTTAKAGAAAKASGTKAGAAAKAPAAAAKAPVTGGKASASPKAAGATPAGTKRSTDADVPEGTTDAPGSTAEVSGGSAGTDPTRAAEPSPTPDGVAEDVDRDLDLPEAGSDGQDTAARSGPARAGGPRRPQDNRNRKRKGGRR